MVTFAKVTCCSSAKNGTGSGIQGIELSSEILLIFQLAENWDGGEDVGYYPVPMPASETKSSKFSLSPAAAKLRLLKKLRCTLRYEKNAWASGAVMVAGVDEG